MIKLIVGLGNPGKEYARTRHNIGWWVLDEIAKEFHENFSREKFKGIVAEIPGTNGKVTLLKPLTFMNKSGESVANAANFYKLQPEEILVISDDLDMPIGKVRIRLKGKHGGHRGLMSVEKYLGTDNFPRLKIGIGRPNVNKDVSNYVLQPFTEDQLPIIEQSIKKATEWIIEILDGKHIEAKSASF